MTAQATVPGTSPSPRAPHLIRWWRREGLLNEAHAYRDGTSGWTTSVCGAARWTAAVEPATRGPVCAGCAAIVREALDRAAVDLAELDVRERLDGIEQHQSEGR